MSILDRYGIKEVADVTFYELDKQGNPTDPVLFLDTLKVSTIEQTAENTAARGGKGNPEIIIWDYNKEITVTLEDALFSSKSMAVMFGALDKNGNPKFDSAATLKKTVMIDETATSKPTTFKIKGEEFDIPSDAKFYKANGGYADASGTATGTGAWATGAAFCVFDYATKNANEITISSDKFPGTYYITGDTYARNENSGEDEFFQFIIPKAKILSEVTLTLEAEGDPTTFSMNVKVLRAKDNEMMKLVKYDLDMSPSE